MHLSCTVMEIWRRKDNGVTTLDLLGVMRRHRSRDQSTPKGLFPMGGP